MENAKTSGEQAKTSVKKSSSDKKILFAILGIVILALVGGGGYMLALQKNKINQIVQQPASPLASTTASQPSVTAQTQNHMFSGSVQKLSQDLGIFIQTPDQKLNNINQAVTYYSAGIYTSGKYLGYTRYVAIQEAQGPGGPTTYVFASQNSTSFILDGKPVDVVTQKNDDFNSPIYGMNPAKISAIDRLPSEHPDMIPLDSKFALSKGSVMIGSGNPNSALILLTDFSSYPTVSSPAPALKLYGQNSLIDPLYPQPSPTSAPTDNFIAGTTKTIAQDSTGLAYGYTLANPQQIANYPALLDVYNAAVAANKSDPKKPYPNYPDAPSLALKAQDIQGSAPVYNAYNIAMPQNCASGGVTLVAKNINDADLQKIGTSTDGDIYVLSDKNHALNKAEFADKISSIQSPSDFKQINNGASIPTYDAYVSKNPLLFVKDFWGRWVILGEYEYRLQGGCGKPVIYLYPEKPTNVSIEFLTPITFDLAIPSYHNGWNVIAQSDGTLIDLQPQFTDCRLIDSTKPGSEYAQNACLQNVYPYLYWAGRSTEKAYPNIAKGWIVARNDVTNFINQTLDVIGFNAKEKSDFVSYWVPQMLSHNDPYFRISFLQNPEMDAIAPMKVVPEPSHYYRYFLDYLPLSKKPAVDILPETLTKIVRSGFTLVEWGGHLR